MLCETCYYAVIYVEEPPQELQGCGYESYKSTYCSRTNRFITENIVDEEGTKNFKPNLIVKSCTGFQRKGDAMIEIIKCADCNATFETKNSWSDYPSGWKVRRKDKVSPLLWYCPAHGNNLWDDSDKRWAETFLSKNNRFGKLMESHVGELRNAYASELAAELDRAMSEEYRQTNPLGFSMLEEMENDEREGNGS